MKKLKLSSYWWANFWFLLALTLAAEIGLFLLMKEVLLIPMVLVALMFLLGAYHPWRFLLIMEIDDHVYRSNMTGIRSSCFPSMPVPRACFLWSGGTGSTEKLRPGNRPMSLS